MVNPSIPVNGTVPVTSEMETLSVRLVVDSVVPSKAVSGVLTGFVGNDAPFVTLGNTTRVVSTDIMTGSVDTAILVDDSMMLPGTTERETLVDDNRKVLDGAMNETLAEDKPREADESMGEILVTCSEGTVVCIGVLLITGPEKLKDVSGETELGIEADETVGGLGVIKPLTTPLSSPKTTLLDIDGRP